MQTAPPITFQGFEKAGQGSVMVPMCRIGYAARVGAASSPDERLARIVTPPTAVTAWPALVRSTAVRNARRNRREVGRTFAWNAD